MLRRIFLPEECEVWLNGVKQFRHHGRHTTKMSWPRLPTKAVTQSFNRHPCDRSPRIHFLNRRSEYHVNAFPFKTCAIVVQFARITCEIFIRAELGRVHENGSSDHI